MAKPFITIIGLGLTGTSLGLALKREEGDFDVVGHDREPEAARQASKLGAVDRTQWNLHAAVDGADLVLLALPLHEIDETLGHIAEDLQPGNLVLACVTAMEPAIAAADKHLPETVHFVAAHPILVGVNSSTPPRATLFDGVTFCLAPSVQTAPEAIGLASDFVERVGAKPYYVDAAEHDGIMAGVDQLPQLVAAALMRMFSQSNSWQETQRFAGSRFGNATDLRGSADQLYNEFMANRAALALRLDQLQQELDHWRAWLAAPPDTGAEDEDPPLLAALTQTTAAQEQWQTSVAQQSWDEPGAETADVENPNMMRQLFFGNMFGGRRGRGNDR